MGVAKVTLNGETLIDVTGKTVTSDKMLSAITALDKAGENVTGNITTKSSSDLTASGSTVTVPAGFYSSQVTKDVTSATAFKPAITLTSSTGVITGTNAFTSAYYASSTTTSTLNLTTQAAQTINTSTADQTIASYRWLTGTQTIKSVTTSNLLAGNIKSGVTIKVGDANNASRITQVTGTLQVGTPHTATIQGTGNSTNCYVQYNGTKYYTDGNTFTFYDNDAITFYTGSTGTNVIEIGGGKFGYSDIGSPISYSYTAIGCDILIQLNYGTASSEIQIDFVNSDVSNFRKELALDYGGVTPTESQIVVYPNMSYYGLAEVTVGAISSTYVGTGVAKKSAADLTANLSTVTVPSGYYSSQVTKSISAGSAFPPAVTITKIPSATLNSSTGIMTIAYSGSSSITPTVTPGYISQGTPGIISTTGATQYNLPIKEASVYTPTTISQYIPSYQWLTGSQTIIGDSNLVSENIKSGISIFGVVGTLSGGGADQPYYELFKAIAENSSAISSDISGMTEYLQRSVSAGRNIIYNEFEGRVLSGDFVISSHQYSIQSYAFALNDSVINKPYYSTAENTFSFTSIEMGRINQKAFYRQPITKLYGFGLKAIESQAFQYCSKLSQIDTGHYEGAGLGNIGPSAFAYCSALESVYMCITPGDAGVNIGISAFAYCTHLSQLNFSRVTSIGQGAFYNCSALESVVANYLTESIYSSAFTNCSSLSYISIKTPKYIGINAFASCINLKEVFIYGNSVYIEQSAFYNCITLSSVVIYSCSRIRGYVFNSCSSLEYVSITGNLSIEARAFNNCPALKIVSLYSITSIAASTFYNCPALETVYINNFTGSLGAVFVSCTSLKELMLLAPSVISLYNINAFSKTPIGDSSYLGYFGSIYVPSSLYSNYTTSNNWSNYWDRFVSIIE